MEVPPRPSTPAPDSNEPGRSRKPPHLTGVDAPCPRTPSSVTSELVTNACVHAKGGDGTVLWPAVEDGRLRVVVYDGDENPPVIRELTAEPGERGGGRGLYLVDALTEGRWGHGPDVPYGGQLHPEGKGCGSTCPQSCP
ncbi:ATP-binding protein [Streptomyces sp. L7]